VFAVEVHPGVGALAERVWLVAGSGVVVQFLREWVGGAESEAGDHAVGVCFGHRAADAVLVLEQVESNRRGLGGDGAVREGPVSRDVRAHLRDF